MTNWILIYVGKVIAVIEKEGNINDSDYEGVWDTVTEDPSKTFKVGDDFTAELQLEYNKEIWREMGLYVGPIELPENVVTAKLTLQNALKDANIDTLVVYARDGNE